MAKFKKLAMLCAALIATASMATGCSVLDGILSSLNSSSEASSAAESTVDSTVSEEESSEEENSEQVSESAPVEDENAYYTCIVDGEAAAIEVAEAYSTIAGTLTFNAPKAGLYAIYAVDADFFEAGVMFGAADAANEDEHFVKYLFNVEEAGEATVSTSYYAWDEGTFEYFYYIYHVVELEVNTESGSAELLANIPVPVTVVAPAAGSYVLSISQSVDWYTDIESAHRGNGEYAKKTTITATEAGEKITVFVKFDNMDKEGFDFEWTLAEKVVPVLVAGDNEINAPNGEAVEFTFTPETSGTFTFTASSENTMFGVWSEEYGGYIDYDVSGYSNIYNVALEAGVTYTIYMQYSNWEDESDIVENVNISGFVSDDVSNITEVGSYTFEATAEGVVITFTAPEAGQYSFFDEIGYSFWFEGNEEETDYAEFYLAAGESISFTAKYDGIVKLTIEKMPEIVTLDLGETTVNVPKDENELQFNADNGDYTLTWDNENVIVYVNGMNYTSGSVFSIDYYSSYAITTEDGSAINDVTFTLTVYVYPTVKLGDNTITVDAAEEEKIYKFYPTEIGCYTFTFTGEAICYVEVNSAGAIDYPDALSEAGSISININEIEEIALSVYATAACEAIVNVAYNTTISMFESAVTMDETTMSPVSLTIASIAPGECLYFAASRMVGDYVISWSEEYNIAVYAGENVGTAYDGQIRLTRTMMDGYVYIVIRNYDYEGTTYENVVLNISAYVAPAAEPQGQIITLDEETTIEIASLDNVIISFVAEEAGTYTLTTTSSVLVDLWQYSESWEAYDRVWQNPIDSTEGGSYTFTLEAGQIIDFFVMEYDMGEVSFVFTITKA